jgi:hypothetical protein
MKTLLFRHLLAIAGVLLSAANLWAQESTPPFSATEREQVYAASISKRAAGALEQVALADSTKSNKLHAVITDQYRALRARDEALDNMFKALSKDAPGVETNRVAVLAVLSRQLHRQFVDKLSAELTPAQVEVIKDKMTYNKLKVTFDAYCLILPNLTQEQKDRVLSALRDAREEAMDGGSADEKSAIFQKYKDQINAYLGQHGYDVAKATREWEAKQASATPVDTTQKPAN